MPLSLQKRHRASLALPLLFVMIQPGLAWAQAPATPPTIVPAQAPASPSGPAVELPPATIVPLFGGFVKSCTEGMKADSKFASFYCPCAAAFMVDRFSVDELNDEKNASREGLEQAHSGTTKRLALCAQAAKQQDAK